MNVKDRLQQKIDYAVKTHSGNARDAIRKLINQEQAMEDWLIPNRKLIADCPEDIQGIRLMFYAGNGPDRVVKRLVMHPNAIVQLSSRLEIPSGWAKDAALSSDHWKRRMITTAFMHHLPNMEEKRFLIRSVNGEARAVLSDRYRKIGMVPVFTRFADAAQGLGATLYNGHLSDLRGFLEVIIPKVYEFETENNGTAYRVFGAQISSSDFGHGSLDVRGFSIELVCMNGMIGQKALKKVHLGSRMGDDIAYSDRTYQLDTDAMGSATIDVLNHVLGKEFIETEIRKSQGLSAKEIDIDKEVKLLPNRGITKEESEMIRKLLLENREDDGIAGKPTMYKLQQAISAGAKRLVDPVRIREVQLIAGEIQ